MAFPSALVTVCFMIVSIATASPLFAQRAPDPPAGQLIPFSTVRDRFEPVVQDLARRYPSYLARACTSRPPTNREGRNMEWMIGVAQTLHNLDSRWGFNWKRGEVGNPSSDVLAYHAGRGPDESSTQFDADVYGIDLIADCGGRNVAQFGNITANGALKWARWVLQAPPTPPPPPRLTGPVNGDYDGDGGTDLSVFRRDTGQWFVTTSAGAVSQSIWGVGTDVPVPGDYDGDRRADTAVYRPSTGEWWVARSAAGGWTRAVWGVSTDVPVPADYDGDGRTDLAVYRPATGEWWIVRSSSGAWTRQVWGTSTDRPQPADYDGDGKADVAVYRPATGEWWIVYSETGNWSRTAWGTSTDVPVAGDYDGDRRADLAVFRPPTGEWWIVETTSGGWRRAVFGSSLDTPVPGDYDKDGKIDLAVYRSVGGGWGGILSSNGQSVAGQWGGDPSDVPATGSPR